MVLFTLRAADEVRASQFASAESDLDAEMVAIAGAIIKRRTGKCDPSTYRDRYQEALRALIEAKMKGIIIAPREVSATTRDRSDGGAETQSRAGGFGRDERCDDQRE